MAGMGGRAATGLTPAEALRLRKSLVEDGYALIPGVCCGSLLQRLREWSDQLLDNPVVNSPHAHTHCTRHVVLTFFPRHVGPQGVDCQVPR